MVVQLGLIIINIICIIRISVSIINIIRISIIIVIIICISVIIVIIITTDIKTGLHLLFSDHLLANLSTLLVILLLALVRNYF